jgi:hypothetical protein
MTTPFMGERETIAAFDPRGFFWVQALVEHDSGLVEKHCPKDIGATLGIARNAKQPVGVVELDAELEVLLDDIFDGDWRRDGYASSVRVFGQ